MVMLLICTVLVMKSHGLSSDCQECEDYLISGPRGIPDSHLTASSIFENSLALHDPKYGRLNFYLHDETTGHQAAAWSARYNNDQQYIQAVFSSVKLIKAIKTQGRYNLDQWVKSYYVSYSTDGVNWANVLGPEKTTMVFQGNTDRTTAVNNALPECVKAKYLRIHPKIWHGHVSLRFDVIGCTAVAKSTLRNQMNWKRHLIDINPTVYRNIRKDNVSSASDMKTCAIQCQKKEQCVMFSFNEKYGTCTGFPSQIYQGKKSTITSSDNDQYFISLSHFNVYEYEIMESKIFGYKIFTWRTTALSASNKCQEEGARLLTVHDLDQMEYVQNKIKDNLILSQQSKYFVDGSHKDGKWTYSTGIDVPPGLWSPSHPQITNGSCVTLTLTSLETHDCNDKLYFVCGV